MTGSERNPVRSATSARLRVQPRGTSQTRRLVASVDQADHQDTGCGANHPAHRQDHTVTATDLVRRRGEWCGLRHVALPGAESRPSAPEGSAATLTVSVTDSGFTGFGADGLRFLAELEQNNSTAFFAAHRQRHERDLLAPAKQFVTALGGEVRRQVSAGLHAEPGSGRACYRSTTTCGSSRTASPTGRDWISCAGRATGRPGADAADHPGRDAPRCRGGPAVRGPAGPLPGGANRSTARRRSITRSSDLLPAHRCRRFAPCPGQNMSAMITGVERVTGIGGVFFRSKDPELLTRWYAEHLGVQPPPASYDDRSWEQQAGPTVFTALPSDSEHFRSPRQQWSVNFRVRDLDAMIAQLRAAGIDVDEHVESYPNGRFAELVDPDGTPIQLWEPAGADSVE